MASHLEDSDVHLLDRRVIGPLVDRAFVTIVDWINLSLYSTRDSRQGFLMKKKGFDFVFRTFRTFPNIHGSPLEETMAEFERSGDIDNWEAEFAEGGYYRYDYLYPKN